MQRPLNGVPNILERVLTSSIGELQRGRAETVSLIDEICLGTFRIRTVSTIATAHARQCILLKDSQDYTPLIESGCGFSQINLHDALFERCSMHSDKSCIWIEQRLLLYIGIYLRELRRDANRIRRTVVWGGRIKQIVHTVQGGFGGHIPQERHQISNVECDQQLPEKKLANVNCSSGPR